MGCKMSNLRLKMVHIVQSYHTQWWSHTVIAISTEHWCNLFFSCVEDRWCCRETSLVCIICLLLKNLCLRTLIPFYSLKWNQDIYWIGIQFMTNWDIVMDQTAIKYWKGSIVYFAIYDSLFNLKKKAKNSSPINKPEYAQIGVV